MGLLNFSIDWLDRGFPILRCLVSDSVLNQDETHLLYSLVFGEGVVNDATSVVLFNAIQSLAIEVVDLEQKIKELDGHVMRCVRDHNGNHVIQKCIECVPEENIQFIVSTFFGQVLTLSTHPYGCRVIQRVLEHCHDLDTQSKVMLEIISSVSMLEQDQYGNYVIHVCDAIIPNNKL